MNDKSNAEQDNGKWEQVQGARPKLFRLKVPGGWLLTITGGSSYPVTFYPDSGHKWNPPIKS